MTTAPKLANLSGIEEVLAGSLTQERWFADKHRTIEALRLTQVYSVQQETPALVIVLVEVTFADGLAATYQMLVGLRPWDRHLSATLRSISRRVGAGDDAEGTHPGPTWAVYDGLADPLLAAELLAILSQGSSIKGDGSGELRCRLLHPPLPPLASLQPSQMAPKDQSQSSVLFGDDILVKVLRRVWPGTSPEVEILEALDRAGFAGIARPLGVIEARADGDVVSLAVAQSYLRNGTDGFSLALTSLRDLYGDRLLDADGAVPLPENCVKAVQRQGSSFAGAAAQIGALTGQMHLALAGLNDTPELEARQLSRDDLQIIADDLDSFVERLVGLDDPRLEPLAVHASALHELAQRVVGLTPTGRAIRIHGDYHLGQLLRTDAGWHALDFEGRPALPVAVRRRKATPLQDLAGMLRSFDYAATVALRQQVHATDASAASLEPYGRAWSGVARDAFLGRYLSTIANTDLLPSEPETVQLLLTCLQASQALYEVDYEMRSRPDWVSIPLEGIARLLSAPPGGPGVS
ncbi:MAG: maltokinase N-terminal cap-like domain-containing protein [Candidatus Dormibacteria bacterium]